MAQPWRKCSSCKKDIMTGQKYYLCSVSTCRGAATNYVFCSIACWDAHVPIERHRSESAGAIEKVAGADPAPAPAGQRKIVSQPSAPAKQTTEDEVLVVVTKVRKYIADKSGMNTSGGVYDVLTDRIKNICDKAIENARAQGRKTVMDRDVP
jgi:hypothetical protein